MGAKTHHYAVKVVWTGNTGAGTLDYRSYSRNHLLRAGEKPEILGSSDPAFRGDSARWNPEDLLLGALAACHKLWFLHLASQSGIVVVAYEDAAEGEMIQDETGGGRFASAILRPVVTITPVSDVATADALHAEAAKRCFVKNSVAFPVACEPMTVLADPGDV